MELERPAAAQRQGTRTDLSTFSPRGLKVKKRPQSTEIAAQAVDMSRVTYQRAKYVMDTDIVLHVSRPVLRRHHGGQTARFAVPSATDVRVVGGVREFSGARRLALSGRRSRSGYSCGHLVFEREQVPDELT